MRRCAVAASAVVALILVTATTAFAALGDPYFDTCKSRIAAGACVAAGVVGRPSAMVIAPGGTRAYVAFMADSNNSGAGVQVYDRDPATGSLTPRTGATGCVSSTGAGNECATYANFDTAELSDIAIDPLGKNLYVAADYDLFVLDIDDSGGISVKNAPDGCLGPDAGCTAIAGWTDNLLAVELDQAAGHAYVRGEDRLWVFDRNSGTGVLTQKPTTSGCISETVVTDCTDAAGIGGNGFQMSFSPDGNDLYTSNQFPGGIAVFVRSSDGTLSQPTPTSGGCMTTNGSSSAPAECVNTSNPTMGNSWSALVEPLGDYVYVSGSGGTTAFHRDHSTGLLTMVACYVQGASGGGCAGRQGIRGLELAAIGDGSELIVGHAGTDPAGFQMIDRATGQLTQRTGTHGCWSGNGSGGSCEILPIGLSSDPALAVSADDHFVYLGGASADPDGTMSTLHRDRAPTCGPVSAEIVMNTATPVVFKCSDPDGDGLTYSIAGFPASGGLGAFDQASGRITYSPFSGFTGADSFTYAATALGLTTAPATVSLSVAAPPPLPVGPPAGATGEPPAPTGQVPGPTASPGVVTAGVVARWQAGKQFTRVAKLVVTAAESGSLVTVTCKGKGCPFKARKPKLAGGKADLTAAFKTARLRPAVVLEFRVLRPGAVGRVFRYTVRKGKNPTASKLCLAPGAAKPEPCAA